MGDSISIKGDESPNNAGYNQGSFLADHLISQLKAVANNPDLLKGASDAQIHEFRRYSTEAAEGLEKDFEMLRRINFSPLRLVVPRLAQQHGIFEMLINANGRPVTLGELSEATQITSFVLEVVMDYLCTQRWAQQVGSEEYAATKFSHRFMEPSFRDGMSHFHDNVYQPWAYMRKAMREPLPARTAFQMGYDTDDDFYEYLGCEKKKAEREAFHRFMKSYASGLPLWLSVVDFEAEFGRGLTDGEVAFVDVGGGNGQQCEALKAKHPGLPGRVILQDRPEALSAALDVPGMEKMVYDYHTEQPIRDARVYYFRFIFHNNDDETSVQILRSQLPAMGPNSALVIDDKVLPDDKLAPYEPGAEASAGLSLTMKTLFNTVERRENHWRRMLRGSGLVVRDIRWYTDFSDAVIILGNDVEVE
ncbi:Demethylsterigmatocystin 6-O-methyltransferase-like protein [Hapsidospora chrysogenum ATCC 11550]|uniref:Demethylsterigmatocystin 6-O-methyltransferase-like protein n=1 Tax=Hapsidospora chrysogenum (strain ATCC 11550 / CBS 779.69 / DSM 880 / IAM 14645 / JCM 23072 / IMI 49137) TaxID=857340 RepID=A0A086TGC5_HAPC1|nr:Demethylsterigmatocystin 6-O-methyltransferase-like protein [Hapsidospora chrysogenum ATCC 11550]